jgi:hypothetical protein
VSATAELTHDLTRENLLSLAQAARRFPPFRLGRPVSPSCVWRWCRQGVKAPGASVVRLEAVRVSGRWLTSAEAISRFVARQTPAGDNEVSAPTPPPRTPGQRRRGNERAARVLEKARI